MREHVLRGLVDGPVSSRDVVVGLALPGKPLGSEEPGLVGGDRHVTADSYRPVFMHRELNLIAFSDVQRASDLFRQGELRLRPHPGAGLEPGLGLPLGRRHRHNQTIQDSVIPTI